MVIEIPLSSSKYPGMVARIDEADAGTVAVCRSWSVEKRRNTFYAQGFVNGRVVRMHKLILPEASRVDHADGDGLNNTRTNLRPATNAQNHWNIGPVATNKSGFKGVCRHSGTRWVAQIKANGQKYYLGLFESPEAAAHAYDRAALALHGEFAWVNFPTEVVAGQPAAGVA